MLILFSLAVARHLNLCGECCKIILLQLAGNAMGHSQDIFPTKRMGEAERKYESC